MINPITTKKVLSDVEVRWPGGGVTVQARILNEADQMVSEGRWVNALCVFLVELPTGDAAAAIIVNADSSVCAGERHVITDIENLRGYDDSI